MSTTTNNGNALEAAHAQQIEAARENHMRHEDGDKPLSVRLTPNTAKFANTIVGGSMWDTYNNLLDLCQKIMHTLGPHRFSLLSDASKGRIVLYRINKNCTYTPFINIKYSYSREVFNCEVEEYGNTRNVENPLTSIPLLYTNENLNMLRPLEELPTRIFVENEDQTTTFFSLVDPTKVHVVRKDPFLFQIRANKENAKVIRGSNLAALIVSYFRWSNTNAHDFCPEAVLSRTTVDGNPMEQYGAITLHMSINTKNAYTVKGKQGTIRFKSGEELLRYYNTLQQKLSELEPDLIAPPSFTTPTRESGALCNEVIEVMRRYLHIP